MVTRLFFETIPHKDSQEFYVIVHLEITRQCVLTGDSL